MKDLKLELRQVERKLREANKLYRELRQEKESLYSGARDREPRLNLSKQLVLLSSTTERLLRLRHQLKKGLEKNE